MSQLEDNDNHSTAAINLIIFLLEIITTISANSSCPLRINRKIGGTRAVYL